MTSNSSGNWRFWLVGVACFAFLGYMIADASGAFVAAKPAPAATVAGAVPAAPATTPAAGG